MKGTLKSEFRKLFTIRSTYLLIAFALLINVLFAFYITGWRIGPEALRDPGYLASQSVSAAGLLALFSALIAVISLTQEYRYNTIMYSLTASKGRLRLLLAKIIIISVFAIAFTALMAFLSPLLTVLAVHMHGQTFVPQHIAYLDLTWRIVFYGWAYAMFGLLLAALIRVQVGAIVALFLIPGMVEQLLGRLLLKQNSVYLPFSANSAVLEKSMISYQRALLVVLAYLVIGWIIAGWLFARRDAN